MDALVSFALKSLEKQVRFLEDFLGPTHQSIEVYQWWSSP